MSERHIDLPWFLDKPFLMNEIEASSVPDAKAYLESIGCPMWPVTSAVQLLTYLDTTQRDDPLLLVQHVATVALSMAWPPTDIVILIPDFPLPPLTRFVEVLSNVTATLPLPDQLSVLSQSLALCLLACHDDEEDLVSSSQTRNALERLVHGLSGNLGPPSRDPTPMPPSVITSAAPEPAVPALPPPQSLPEDPKPPSGGAGGKGKGKASKAHKATKEQAAPPPPTAQPPAQAPKAKAQVPAPAPTRTTSYAAATAAKPKPKPVTRPSLVISLRHTTLTSTLRVQAGTLALRLVDVCNQALESDARHANVRVSAAKWAPSGNLVVFAGPDTNLTQLQQSHHIITSAIEAALPQPVLLASRPNVKWSKLLINSVPTGVTASAPAHSREECHQALLRDNPSYRRLRVTQLPSWVKKPSLYEPNSSSSLVVSFEDPDGSSLSSLLAARHLFGFGAQLTVRKWRQPPPSPSKRVAVAQRRQRQLATRVAAAKQRSQGPGRSAELVVEDPPAAPPRAQPEKATAPASRPTPGLPPPPPSGSSPVAPTLPPASMPSGPDSPPARRTRGMSKKAGGA